MRKVEHIWQALAGLVMLTGAVVSSSGLLLLGFASFILLTSFEFVPRKQEGE
jgi:hypothetical protein